MRVLFADETKNQYLYLDIYIKYNKEYGRYIWNLINRNIVIVKNWVSVAHNLNYFKKYC